MKKMKMKVDPFAYQPTYDRVIVLEIDDHKESEVKTTKSGIIYNVDVDKQIYNKYSKAVVVALDPDYIDPSREKGHKFAVGDVVSIVKVQGNEFPIPGDDRKYYLMSCTNIQGFYLEE